MRTAVITGANRGLGLATARALAERGFRVLLTSRDRGRGEAAARPLRDAGLAVETHVLDVADPAGVDGFASELATGGVRVDVLVNNAGVASRGCTPAMARSVLDVNYFGAARVTDACGPLLARGSNVVMVSSELGELSAFAPPLRERFLASDLTREGLDALMRKFVDDVDHGRVREVGWPASPYRVSKAGLNALTRIVACAWHGRGIRVNAVCPGWVRTDMGGPGPPGASRRGPPLLYRRRCARTPPRAGSFAMACCGPGSRQGWQAGPAWARILSFRQCRSFRRPALRATLARFLPYILTTIGSAPFDGSWRPLK